jgi:hypothetical protein
MLKIDEGDIVTLLPAKVRSKRSEKFTAKKTVHSKN